MADPLLDRQAACPTCPMGTEGGGRLWSRPGGLSRHSPVHGELLRQQTPVIAARVGGVQAVAYLLADGKGDLEGVGSQLGGDCAAGGGAEGVQGASRRLEEHGARVRGSEGSLCTAHWASAPPAFLPGDCELLEAPAAQRAPPLEGQLSRARAAHSPPCPRGAHANALPGPVLMPSRDYKATGGLSPSLIHVDPLLHKRK